VNHDRGTRRVERTRDGGSVAKIREHGANAHNFSTSHGGNLPRRRLWLLWWPAPPGREDRQMRENPRADKARCAGDEDHSES
jgi:hypothetical protein